MNPVALLTPTYGRDLELCALLCESVDRYVSSFSKHYLLVPDSDLALFAHFESERRCVLPASKFLPKWLRPLPRIIQRNRRQYWWSFRTAPVSGWHVQQLLKIAAAIALPEQRYCILDSDIVFFRDFDLSRFEYPNPIPLLNRPDEVTSDHIRHSHWIETTHRLLGLPTPPFPASDFIGHVIFWDQETTRAMASTIEDVSGLDWVGLVACTRHRVAPPSSDAGDFYQSLLPGALGSLPNKLRRKSPVTRVKERPGFLTGGQDGHPTRD